MNSHCPKDLEISAYLDQALPAPEARRLRDHLQACAACRGQLEGLRQADSALRDLPGITPSPKFEAAFWGKVAQLPEERGRSTWRDRFLLGWRPLLTVGVAAGLVAAVLIYQNPAAVPTTEEVYLAENVELLNELELIEDLELLENWDLVRQPKEQG